MRAPTEMLVTTGVVAAGVVRAGVVAAGAVAIGVDTAGALAAVVVTASVDFCFRVVTGTCAIVASGDAVVATSDVAGPVVATSVVSGVLVSLPAMGSEVAAETVAAVAASVSTPTSLPRKVSTPTRNASTVTTAAAVPHDWLRKNHGLLFTAANSLMPSLSNSPTRSPLNQPRRPSVLTKGTQPRGAKHTIRGVMTDTALNRPVFCIRSG